MGGGFDKQNRFEEAFQRGQAGQVSNYEAWLQDNGIDPQKTSLQYLTNYFQNHTESTVNHEEELEGVAEHLGFFYRRSDVYHLPIIGVSGIGKTQFIHTISRLLEQTAEDVEQVFLDASNFADRGEDEEKIFEIRDNLRELDKTVILVDNCEWERADSLKESLSIINSVVDDAILLTAWTPEYWRHHHNGIEEEIHTSKEIHLSPFDEKDTNAALTQILRIVSDEGLEVPEDQLEEIHGYSSGIPGVFTKLLLQTFQETFHKELDFGSVDAVDAAAGKLNLVGFEEKLYDLSETKLTILTHILLSTDERGVRPSQLVDLLDRDKSTISYHLKDLTESGFVKSVKKGRSAYYNIVDTIEPFVQIRINQEGEFHG